MKGSSDYFDGWRRVLAYQEKTQCHPLRMAPCLRSKHLALGRRTAFRVALAGSDAGKNKSDMQNVLLSDPWDFTCNDYM